MVIVNKGCNNYRHLMRVNVGDQTLRDRGKLLLIGSCMDRYPDIVQDFSEKAEGFAVLHVCLEETHANQAGFKIGSIIKYADITDVAVLTVDGSPHCIQLHYVIEDIKRHFAPEIITTHYVIEKGTVHEISADAVKRSRHLSKIQKMIE
jgi:hypothetical protein